RPYPFTPSVLLDIAPVWDDKIAMLDAHQSQFYEWLPYNGGYADEVPDDVEARREWLASKMAGLSGRLSDRLRPYLLKAFGPNRGRAIQLIEAFEACEY